MKKLQVALIFVVGLALITSCGFRLRGTSGQTPTHLKSGIAIKVENATNDWERVLESRLEAADIPLIQDEKQAPYVLVIQKENLTQNITGVSSSSTPRLYQLTYTVWFTLKTAHNKTLIKPTAVVVTRPLTINNDRVLGSRNEGEKLKHEMKDDAASKIMSYLYRQDSDLAKP